MNNTCDYVNSIKNSAMNNDKAKEKKHTEANVPQHSNHSIFLLINSPLYFYLSTMTHIDSRSELFLIGLDFLL